MTEPLSPPRKRRGSSNVARDRLSRNLQRLRRSRGWTQEVLAAKAQLHRTYLSEVEGCSRNISIDTIHRLATALGVCESELLRA